MKMKFMNFNSINLGQYENFLHELLELETKLLDFYFI